MLNIIESYLEVTTSQLNKDWKQLKGLINECIKKDDKEEAFRLLKALGYIGYRYNFLANFIDEEADDLIAMLTKKIVRDCPKIVVKQERVVFYDYFLLENRGFTQQYIDQIIKNEWEMLFVTLADERDLNEDNSIIKTLKSYSRAKIYVVPYKEKKAEQVKLTVEAIIDYAPSKMFVHNIPYDILPVSVALAIKGSGIKSYFLNISDHTFFLGKNAFDYFIDFRIYGYQLNALCRKIDLSKLLIIPTPPYLTPPKFAQFEGFPVDLKDKVVGFSGGMTYKIMDKKNTFLNLIKKVLDENENFIFLFANVFGSDFLEKFIKKNKLEERFILIGNRSDINEVYKRIDIYINTYPFSGSLMMQYAIAHQKPVLSFSDKELVYVRIDKLFDKPMDEKFVITDEEKFINIANSLINDITYRNSYALELADGINTSEQFEKRFGELLNDKFHQETINMNTFEINTDAVASFHINQDNIFSKEYMYLKSAFFKIKGINKIRLVYVPKLMLKLLGKIRKRRYGSTNLRY